MSTGLMKQDDVIVHTIGIPEDAPVFDGLFLKDVWKQEESASNPGRLWNQLFKTQCPEDGKEDYLVSENVTHQKKTSRLRKIVTLGGLLNPFAWKRGARSIAHGTQRAFRMRGIRKAGERRMREIRKADKRRMKASGGKHCQII